MCVFPFSSSSGFPADLLTLPSRLVDCSLFQEIAVKHREAKIWVLHGLFLLLLLRGRHSREEACT